MNSRILHSPVVQWIHHGRKHFMCSSEKRKSNEENYDYTCLQPVSVIAQRINEIVTIQVGLLTKKYHSSITIFYTYMLFYR